MSIKLKDVDLSTIQTSYSVDTQGKTITDCGWIEFINDSPFTCDINAGGLNVPVIAWERHPIQLQVKNGLVWQSYQGADFPIVVTPRLLTSVDLTQYATTLLTTLYLTGEQPTSIVPSQFIRQPKIVSTNATMSLANQIDNENNPPGTQILKTGVSVGGAPTINQTATNDGLWTLSTLIAGALHQWLKTNSSGSLLQLGNANDITEVLGNTKIDGILGVGASPGTGIGILSWPNADTTIPLVSRANSPTQSADLFQALNSVGVPLAKIDANGNVTTPTVNFTTGSLSRISKFTAGITTTPTFFNHGLGVVPDLVIGVPNGTNPGPFSVQVDFATLTTTQCKLVGNSTFPAVCIAIKF